MLSGKDLEHLAELSRIKLSREEAAGLRKDLEKILAHFEELKTVHTENVPSMSGGTRAESVVRPDGDRGVSLPGHTALEAFPDSKERFLKVPPVFGEE